MFYAEVNSPKPSEDWLSLSDDKRIDKISQIINKADLNFSKQLLVIAAKGDGQIVVRLLEPMTATARGTLLLDFEEYIKNNIDQGLTVWGEALGDKNSLRNLRGIEVKVS
ncbi:MAG: hypothetical protein RLZZ196_245 [Bacteroidota bacterium]